MRRLGRPRPLATLLAAAALLAPAAPAVVGDSSAGAAEGTTRWAAVGRATITPGVQMVTQGAQCTAGFVFRDSRGRVYVGYAAHCAGKGEATDTDGCRTPSHPLGTRVRFEQGGGAATSGTAVGRGRLAYSSWLTMQRLGTRSAAACAGNDFALVRVDAGDVGKVNPTVPHWGGPTGLRTAGLGVGEQVHSYGSSSLRGGVPVASETTSPKTGFSTGDSDRGWSHHVYTLSPGIPGDSGSGLLDATGRAVGVLSTVAIAPVPGENAFGDLARELAFAQRHSGIPGLRLVRGTQPFAGTGWSGR